MSQVNDLISYLKKNKHITPREAVFHLDVWRLAARIPEIREKGYRIDTIMVNTANGKRHARYLLRGKV